MTFSVVVPLYNKRAFVRSTLETVLSQRHPPVEVIVIDDGSTDGSVAAIADLIDERMKVVWQANAGPGRARNHGAALARGEWIALIDADDRWHSRHLENLAGVIAAFPDVDVASAASRWQPASAIDVTLQGSAGVPRRLDYFIEGNSHVVNSSSIAIRRTAWVAAGGFGDHLPGEDSEFWARLALDHRFAMSPLPTSIYVRENGGLMDNYAGSSGEEPAQSVEPFEALISRALSDPRYQERWRDIVGFADRATLSAARNMLYLGNGRGVRAALRRLRGGDTVAVKLYRATSYIPAPVLRSLAQIYSVGKRAMAQGSKA